MMTLSPRVARVLVDGATVNNKVAVQLFDDHMIIAMNYGSSGLIVEKVELNQGQLRLGFKVPSSLHCKTTFELAEATFTGDQVRIDFYPMSKMLLSVRAIFNAARAKQLPPAMAV